MAAPPNDPIDVALGARVRIVRLVRGLSQEVLATAIGVTFQQVQKYERGRNRISASMLSRIATRLGAPVAELCGDDLPPGCALDEVAEILGEPGALDLLEAYSDLSAGGRSALVALLASVSASAA